jgi:hypothetical protein
MSTLHCNTVETSSGGAVTLTDQIVPKARVTFNGTGTIAVLDSFNVASIDDNGTGNYGVNVTNSFDNAYHTPVSTCEAAGNYSAAEINQIVAGGINSMRTWNNDNTTVDTPRVFVLMTGDLA